jgi:hypothetical protein
MSVEEALKELDRLRTLATERVQPMLTTGQGLVDALIESVEEDKLSHQLLTACLGHVLVEKAGPAVLNPAVLLLLSALAEAVIRLHQAKHQADQAVVKE